MSYIWNKDGSSCPHEIITFCQEVDRVVAMEADKAFSYHLVLRFQDPQK